MGLRARRVRHERSGAFEIFLRRLRRERRRRAQQPREREGGEREAAACQRAKRARRVRLDGELPPQLMRVVDVAIRQQDDVADADQDQRDRGEPTWGEGLRAQRAAAIEVFVTRRERRSHRRQHQSLFPIEALRERGRAAADEQREREPVGGVDALLQRAREQQQTHAHHAAEQMRDLEHRKRQQPREQLDAMGDGGRRTREQQDHARSKRRDREGARQQLRHPAGEPFTGDAQRAAALEDLEAREQHEREAERDQVVDDPVREEGCERHVARDPGCEQQHHHRLEDAEARGHVTHQAHDLREQEHAHEAEEAEARHCREQHVEHRRSQRPVERRDRDLRECRARAGQLDLEAAQRQRAPAQHDREQVGDQQRKADQTERPRRDQHRVPRQGQTGRMQAERDSGKAEVAKPEGQHVEGDGAGQLGRRQPPAREHAVTNRAAAEEREPHVVAEDVGDERRERDPAITDLAADPVQRERVIAGEREIAEQRERERLGQALARNRAQLQEDLVEMDRRQLAMEELEGERKQRQADDGA